MDNSLLIALQTQRVLQRRMDIAANNMANVNTPGFRADVLLLEQDSEDPAHSEVAPQDVRFVRDIGMARDMTQGEIAITNNPLDIALEGPGFIMVRGPNGTLYTRDGALSINGEGQLVTSDGYRVLDSGGGEITLDTQGQSPSIGRDGAIRVGTDEVGRIGVVNFARPGALERVGSNLWSAEGQATTDFEGVVMQGALEGSNVHPVIELNRLIEISRAYQSAAQMVSNQDDLRRRTLERLGRAA